MVSFSASSLRDGIICTDSRRCAIAYCHSAISISSGAITHCDGLITIGAVFHTNRYALVAQHDVVAADGGAVPTCSNINGGICISRVSDANPVICADRRTLCGVDLIVGAYGSRMISTCNDQVATTNRRRICAMPFATVAHCKAVITGRLVTGTKCRTHISSLIIKAYSRGATTIDNGIFCTNRRTFFTRDAVLRTNCRAIYVISHNTAISNSSRARSSG